MKKIITTIVFLTLIFPKMALDQNIQANEIMPILELLKEEMPEPFLFSNHDSLLAFFNNPLVKKLNEEPVKSAGAILDFLEKNAEDTNLDRVAVLLLSQYNPQVYYNKLLSILSRSNQRRIQSVDPGIWLTQLPEEQIAADLLHQAVSSGNSFLLLLLQRPVAKSLKHELQAIISQREFPKSMYALYAYKYALEPNDIPFLKQILSWENYTSARGLSGAYLLSLGSKEGLEAIELGLMAPDAEIRKVIYYAVYPVIADTVRIQAKYDVNVSVQNEAIQLLMQDLKKEN